MDTRKKRVLVLATGGRKPDEGGTGFQELVEQSRIVPANLDAEICGVVSNYPEGGISMKSKKLDIPFRLWNGPFTEEGYRAIYEEFERPDFIMCSGWLKIVKWLPPEITGNIHPALLPQYGGKGMFGDHVHERAIADFRLGKIKQTGVTMHFVTPEYDQGPIFFECPVLIREDDDAKSLGKRVNKMEHAWQAYMLNLVVHGYISYVDEKTIEVERGIWNALQQFIPAEKVNVKIRK